VLRRATRALPRPYGQPARRIKAVALFAVQALDRCHQTITATPDLESGKRFAAAFALPVEQAEPPIAVEPTYRTDTRPQPLDHSLTRLILHRRDQPDRIGAAGHEKPQPDWTTGRVVLIAQPKAVSKRALTEPGNRVVAIVIVDKPSTESVREPAYPPCVIVACPDVVLRVIQADEPHSGPHIPGSDAFATRHLLTRE